MIGIGIGIPHSRNIRRLKYLLDEDFAQGATAAYALRLLREKHSGGIVRCRADDQGTSKGEADVLPVLQPDGSKIITLNSPIENFSGTPFSGDNYVLADLVDAGNGNYDGLTSKWYEQTSNKNDASQSVASNQPQIVNAGSVIQENGKPAIDFDGIDDNLDLSNEIDMSQSGFTSFTVQVIKNSNHTGFIIGDKDGGQYNVLRFDEKIFIRDDVGLVAKNNTSTGQLLHSGRADNTQKGKEIFENSQRIKNLDSTQLVEDRSFDALGVFSQSNFTKARGQELILYNFNKINERNKIETNINNHYSIF